MSYDCTFFTSYRDAYADFLNAARENSPNIANCRKWQGGRGDGKVLNNREDYVKFIQSVSENCKLEAGAETPKYVFRVLGAGHACYSEFNVVLDLDEQLNHIYRLKCSLTPPEFCTYSQEILSVDPEKNDFGKRMIFPCAEESLLENLEPYSHFSAAAGTMATIFAFSHAASSGRMDRPFFGWLVSGIASAIFTQISFSIMPEQIGRIGT